MYMLNEKSKLVIHEPGKVIKYCYGSNLNLMDVLEAFEDIKNCFKDAIVHFSICEDCERYPIITIRLSSYCDVEEVINSIDCCIEEHDLLKKLEKDFNVLFTTDFIEDV